MSIWLYNLSSAVKSHVLSPYECGPGKDNVIIGDQTLLQKCRHCLLTYHLFTLQQSTQIVFQGITLNQSMILSMLFQMFFQMVYICKAGDYRRKQNREFSLAHFCTTFFSVRHSQLSVNIHLQAKIKTRNFCPPRCKLQKDLRKISLPRVPKLLITGSWG